MQLLAAWLAGLLCIDSAFLVAVTQLESGTLESIVLTVATVLNVPLFLLAVFLLQTRFRPELQEDSYYSAYLSKKTDEVVRVDSRDARFSQLTQQLEEIRDSLNNTGGAATRHDTASLEGLTVGINKHLPDGERIGSKLRECGILATSRFGTSKAPTKRVVAISDRLPNARVKRVIEISHELAFDGFTYFDNHAEGTDEDILFGSYGGSEYDIAKTSEAEN